VELKDYMNLSAWCNYCRKETKTKEWDCVVCGFSKGHPEMCDWEGCEEKPVKMGCCSEHYDELRHQERHEYEEFHSEGNKG